MLQRRGEWWCRRIYCYWSIYLFIYFYFCYHDLVIIHWFWDWAFEGRSLTWLIWQIYIILNIIPLVITCQHQLVLKNGCSRIAKVKEIFSKNPESKIRNDSFLPLLMQELKAIMKFPGNEFREARILSHNSELNFGTPFCRLWITPKYYTVSHLEEKKSVKNY